MTENRCIRPEIGDRLAAYKVGLLEETERAQFEEHLAKCAWCAAELYAHALQTETLRADPGRHAETLNRRARAQDRSSGPAGLLRRLLQVRVLVPAAAVVATAVALVLLLPGESIVPAEGPTAAGLARVDALPYQPLELRGGTGLLERTLAEGLEAYQTGRYRLAAHQLDTVWKQAGGDEHWSQRYQVALYLGVSLLLSDQPDASVMPLQAAAAARLRPVAERGSWYLAQARLLQERPCDSIQLLESLSGSADYGDPAAAQLISVRGFCDTSGSN